MDIRELLDQPREVLENFSSKHTFYAYLGEGDALCRVLAKYLLYVDPSDTSLAPHLIASGFWEAWITPLLGGLSKDAVCADVGANVGYYTMLLADLCAEVHAFEPQPALAMKVRRSAAINGFRQNVFVHTAAAGAEKGFTRLIHSKSGWDELGGVSCAVGTDGQRYENDVPVVRLDDVVEKQLNFVKIDAEGYEPLVWAGMRRHLEGRPTILMEFSPLLYPDPKGFLDEIASCYSLRKVDHNGDIVPVKPEALFGEDLTMLWLEA